MGVVAVCYLEWVPIPDTLGRDRRNLPAPPLSRLQRAASSRPTSRLPGGRQRTREQIAEHKRAPWRRSWSKSASSSARRTWRGTTGPMTIRDGLHRRDPGRGQACRLGGVGDGGEALRPAGGPGRELVRSHLSISRESEWNWPATGRFLSRIQCRNADGTALPMYLGRTGPECRCAGSPVPARRTRQDAGGLTLWTAEPSPNGRGTTRAQSATRRRSRVRPPDPGLSAFARRVGREAERRGSKRRVGWATEPPGSGTCRRTVPRGD